MRVIPVLDLKGGRAVHAVGGDRAHYRPVRSILHDGPDPLGLARAYRDALGLRTLYVADLDAIAGAPPALPFYRAVAGLGISAWIDSGLRDGLSVPPLLDSGASTLVAGLETLRGEAGLAEIVAVAGPERVVFGLDLRGGVPLRSPEGHWGTDDPRVIVEIAMALGVRRVLLLDVARVGRGGGVGTTGLVGVLARTHPEVEIAVGGGVAGPGDLEALADAGIAAVLVASALLDGRIGADDLRRLASRHGPPGSGQ